MKALLLLTETDHVTRWANATPEHRDRVVSDFQAFDAAARRRGSILSGEALDDPAAARTVRAASDPAGRPVTDGPYTESVEQLGGFYLIEVDTLEIAVELAALLPREYDIEVRPVVDASF